MKSLLSSFRPASALAVGIAGLLLLAAHILFFTWHTDRCARAFDACAIPANTISGLPEPRFFTDYDAYAWMSFARESMAGHGWRIRHTFMDNAPYGREMHWSHPLVWTLRRMATAIMARTGWPAARAVELAGVWVMALWQFLFLAMAFLVLSKKLGWLPAGLFCLLSLSLIGLSYAFYPLQPDHHGLQLYAVLFAFICLQLGGMGWTQEAPASSPTVAAFRPWTLPSAGEARRWFLAAGFFGGLALWVGATVWLFALAVIALAAVSALPALFRSAGANDRYRPGLWRLWARSGVTTAAFFYLLEYAPAHLTVRLEVNHPLYWLCWLGVAEILCFAGQNDSFRFWKNHTLRDWTRAGLGVLAAMVLPLLVLFGPAEWHQMNHPLLQRLVAGFIDEFQSVWPSIQARPVQFFFSNMGILPLFVLVLGIQLARSRGRPRAGEAPVRAALVFACLFFLLMLWQLRWGYLACGALLWLGILALPFWTAPPQGPRMLVRLAAAALFVNVVGADLVRLREERLASTAQRVPPSWIRASLSKRTALQWGLAAGTNQWRMVGMATHAPLYYYFAGIQAVASYYWENAAGWQAETDFFADESPGKTNALRIARERGLTHAFAKPTDALPRLYTTLQTGEFDPAAIRESLAGQLAFPQEAHLPPWIQLDAPLTAMADKMYVFQTPEGLVGQPTVGHVLVLQPDNESSAE